jgi:molybdopterin-dependent oxidoreductase alpha subunit
MNGSPSAEPPLEGDGLRTKQPPKVAAGIPAVLHALQHAVGKMGPLRAAQTLIAVNQADGFDCPGCAWPDPEHRATAEFCENGAKAVAEEATTKRILPEFFAQHSLAELSRESDHWLGQQGRLTHPMVLLEGSDHYEPISWLGAFSLLADELNRLASPDEAVFYTSGRTSNEAAFLYQLFVRQFGANNLPDCSNMCHESSGTALGEVLGVGKGTVSLEDFDHTDAIFILGQNPGTNHPRMLTTLETAARRGAKIVSINPLEEVALVRFRHPQHPLDVLGSGTPIATLHLPVRINGDVAAMQGIMKAMLEEEERRPGHVFDHEFLRDHTSGLDEFLAHLRATSWPAITAASGLTKEEMERAASIAVSSRSIIACWAMGLTQHENAVANIQQVTNFLLLGGHIGRQGAGVCPVRGHSNVQGDRTMGIFEKMPDAFLDSLGAEFHFSPPRRHGYDTVNAIRAMHEGRAHVFLGMGGNFLSATPDTEYTAEALRRCRLTAHVSTKLNRSHLITGRQALILPCLGRTEIDRQAGGPQFVTVEDSMSMVHASQGNLAPASEHLRSECAIVAGIARATLGARSTVDWDALIADYGRIRDAISRVVDGCDDYNTRVRARGGFRLPNAARERRFLTSTGKARFTVHPIPAFALPPGQLLMMTIRSHDQFNTTIYGLDDRYRGIHNGRRVIFLNPEDMQQLGIEAGQRVDITSHFRGEQRIAREFTAVPYKIPRRCAATYFPEANVLVPISAVAEKSNTPASKSVVISLALSKPSATA